MTDVFPEHGAPVITCQLVSMRRSGAVSPSIIERIISSSVLWPV
jgi:hypothetical protein